MRERRTKGFILNYDWQVFYKFFYTSTALFFNSISGKYCLTNSVLNHSLKATDTLV